MKELGLPVREHRDREAAILFAACPTCTTGDLSILVVKGQCLAACSQCKYVGVLASTYPALRRKEDTTRSSGVRH